MSTKIVPDHTEGRRWPKGDCGHGTRHAIRIVAGHVPTTVCCYCWRTSGATFRTGTAPSNRAKAS